MVVINVVDCSIEPYPLDWLTALPAFLDRLQLGIVFRHLRVAVHARCSVRHVGLRRDFDKTVTIAAIHPELCHVNIVWKRHWLDRLVSDLCVLWRAVIPSSRSYTTGEHDHANDHLDRYPIAPAWKEIRHDARRPPRRHCAGDKSATADWFRGELRMNKSCGQDVLRSDAASG